MRHGDALDLVRVHVEAGHVDHVLLAVLDVDEAALVHAADVAGAQPAVGQHHLRGLLRAVPVALHDLGSAYADLAGLADGQHVAVVVGDADLGRGDRQTDGVVELLGDRVDAGAGRGLGETPGLRQDAAGHLLPAFGDRALHGHAAAQGAAQRAEVHRLEAGGVQQRVEERVHARDVGELVLLQFLHEAREVARVRDEDIGPAEPQEHDAVPGEREDVVQRQRRDRDAVRVARPGGFGPGGRLQGVRGDVAVAQHRALGDAGRAAGVLQEGEVVVADVHLLQRMARARREHIVETVVARQRPRGDLLAHRAHHEVDDRALGEAEQLADARHHHMLDLRAADDLLQHMGEVLEDDDGLGAGILELVFELAGGVERVGVDHRAAGAQHAEQRDGVLQQVRHHDGDTAAALEAGVLLQPGAEGAGLRVELSVGDRAPHLDERDAVGVTREALFGQMRDRADLGGVDVGRHAGGVGIDPIAGVGHAVDSSGGSAGEQRLEGRPHGVEHHGLGLGGRVEPVLLDHALLERDL